MIKDLNETIQTEMWNDISNDLPFAIRRPGKRGRTVYNISMTTECKPDCIQVICGDELLEVYLNWVGKKVEYEFV